MRKQVLTIAAGLALSSMAAVAAVTGLVPVSGHVPAAVRQLNANGVLPSTNTLQLAIGLPLRNQADLTNLLSQLYDPASTNFHKFLTPDEFTTRFGPSEADYQSVINFAKQNGLNVTGTSGNRMIVDVTAPVSSIQKAFGVTLRTYPHPKEARNFYSPDTEPSVPANLPILHISGLDNYELPHPNFHAKPAGLVSPAAGSSPGGGYMGADFRNAYVPGTALDGTGQKVGLLQFFSGFFQSDITAYEQLANLPNVPVIPVLLDGYGGGPGIGNDEVSLDIEMVISMAPGVSSIYVFEGENTDDILNSMASSNQVKQLSASWTYPIDSTSEQIYQQFAAQGQSFFNASGDNDAYVDGVPTPADDPYVTVVGGTTLTTANDGSFSSESVWNWGPLGLDGVGSSGGISTTYPLPYWQTNIDMSHNGGSTTMRNLPDVALTGDNVFIIYGGGIQSIGGGTSCATPLWASFMSLVNQQATAANPASLGQGFINPVIYNIARSANYTNCFHDVTVGNNTWSQSPNRFFARTGYDLCTGWGSPNGTNLINALVGLVSTHISAPLPPYGTTLSALNGGDPNGTWNMFITDDQVLNSGYISNGWNMTITLANPVGSSADLAVAMAASSGMVLPGSNVTYTITVTNYGPSISTNVEVQDSLPPGATLVSAVPDLGKVVNGVNALVWNVTNLVAGAGSQLLVTITTPTTPGDIYNYALGSSTTPDPNPDDDLAALSVTVGTPAPPEITGTFIYNSGTFQFAVAGTTGKLVIQASTNLMDWVPVYTNPAPYSVPFNFTDPAAGGYQDRFYRAVTVP